MPRSPLWSNIRPVVTPNATAPSWRGSTSFRPSPTTASYRRKDSVAGLVVTGWKRPGATRSEHDLQRRWLEQQGEGGAGTT